jgi:N,N'-diacetyllegionaminate synthase
MRVVEHSHASGDVGLLTRDEKEAQGLVPWPVRFDGFKPLRWADFRLIAEAGRCRNDAEWAVRAVEAAALAGFWGFKVQMLSRWEICTADAPRYGRQPGVQADDFAGSMDRYQWQQVQDACRERGLLFFASCWGEDSVDLALNLGVPLLKVGSGDITNELLLRYVGGCGVPVILSTGASMLHEIDDALGWLCKAPQIALAACTLAYPTEMQDANLGRVGVLKRRFPDLLVGYSDHCKEPWIVGQAKKAGAVFVEAHWTVTPGEGGDDDFALHPGNIQSIFDEPTADGEVWGSEMLCDAELPALRYARRSLATRLPLVKDDRIRLQDLGALRPGTGIPPSDWRHVLGRRVSRDYEDGELLDPRELG